MARSLVLAHGVLAMFAAHLAFAAPPTCFPERYFAPHDTSHRVPLRAPHAELARDIAAAAAGVGSAQRSLGAAYEAGYLVDRCHAKAAYWYGRAAEAGDGPAKEWAARHARLEMLRAGPECAGRHCAASAEGPQLVELVAKTNGGFATPVTINDVTVSGVVDTGATFVSMNSRTARSMGLAYERGRAVTMMTANGSKTARLVTIPEVRVGDIVLRDVTGSVSEGEMPLLLGMSFLARLRVTINEGRMTLATPGFAPLPVEGDRGGGGPPP